VVRLLLGEEPERADFEARGAMSAAARSRAAMRPYLALAIAVRSGDVAAFGRVESEHHATFEADRTHNLVGRLRYNVLRAGLRRISLAYSRISLQARPLLPSPGATICFYECLRRDACSSFHFPWQASRP
jgi:26S proteasome regulatory subunit N3